MKPIIFIALIFVTAFGALGLTQANAETENGEFSFSPRFDLRVRQEILDGVFHFAPDPHRNWIRVRTRAGVRAENNAHRFEVLLTNEHRHYLTPSEDLDWDEVILDQAYWTWTINEANKLTLGRQNIIWDKGFLMLEGHPLDGSRSIYHNAVRLQADPAWGHLDLALINNEKYDEFVLIDDKTKPLSDADENAVAVRAEVGRVTGSFIWKEDVDPDEVLKYRRSLTFAGRYDFDFNETTNGLIELAYQYHSGLVPEGGAWAFQTEVGHRFTAEGKGKLGLFYYSGENGDRQAFRAPWGRWPKWSELYIYTLIGESTPGRVHVAAWENIAAPHMTINQVLNPRIDARLSAYYLLAPEPDWQSRGTLFQMELKFKLAEGLRSHLLWEMLNPGDFHNGDNGLAPVTDTVHFVRWQVSYAL